MSLSFHHHIHTRIHPFVFDVYVAPQYTSGPGRSNQFHLPATFTWIVCRALSSLLLSSCQAFGAPGISRMRLDARSRIYPAQTLLRCTDILVADFSLSSFCRRPVLSHSACLRYASSQPLMRPRHLIEKPHTK